MEKLEVTRNAQTDQFSVVLSRGNDTIRCMVTVEASRAGSNEEKHRAALSKAKALAKALSPRCPSCGSELEWKADLPLFSTIPDTKFFQCKSCDRFHTSEIKALKPDPAL